MAEKKTSRPKRRLNEDELVEALVPDPSQAPDVRAMAGFLGKSSRQGYWRLYRTSDLNSYVEFRQEDVVHTQSLEGDQNRLGGTVVWVRREANLLHTSTGSREAQADFLQGAVTNGFLNRPAPPGTRIAPFQSSRFNRPRTLHVSCVPEFCEFVPATWFEDAACTWEAECP